MHRYIHDRIIKPTSITQTFLLDGTSDQTRTRAAAAIVTAGAVEVKHASHPTHRALARTTVAQAPVEPRVVVGDGAMRYAEEVAHWIGAAPVPLESLPPGATMLLALLERGGTGRAIEDPVTAEPVYGRPAEAQARWEARHGRPLPDSPRPAG